MSQTKMRIQVVGLGYVGQAVYEGLRQYYDVRWTDIATIPRGLTYATNKEQTLKDRVPAFGGPFDFVFICVPTPMFPDGSADTHFVEDAVSSASTAALILRGSNVNPPVVVIKSTVPPGTTQRLNEQYSTALNGKFQLVFNPEFLTEANYLKDFRDQTYIIIGGPRPASSTLKQMYTLPFPEARLVKTDSTHAELVKYMTNCFLATKVSFANDMKRICDYFGADYDKVMEYAVLDHRLGKTHWNVPGPDGHMGFDGSCFPKDMNALMAICRQKGIPIPTIRGAWETNIQVRPERDWENLKGRAVIEDTERK